MNTFEKKIKKSNKKNRELFTPDRLNNYLAWTANLGVVPLFLFAAFLLAPELFFFAALLLLVTHVLETIAVLLSIQFTKSNFNFKEIFLPSSGQSVKAFVLLCTASMVYSGQIWANELESEYILTRGEIKILNFNAKEKYSISNKEVIKYQFRPKSHEIVIRALKVGHSILTIFDNNGIPKNIDILVINKNLDEKLATLAIQFKELKIKTLNLGNQLKIIGTLDSIDNFFYAQKIILENKKTIINKLEISNDFKNQILGIIYQQLLKDNIDFIKCEFSDADLSCNLIDSDKISDSYKNFLSDKFGISLIYEMPNLKQNYSVKLKLVQLEQLDGEEIRLGLEQLNSTLGDILNSPIKAVVANNTVTLKNNHIDLSTLAEPQLVMNLRVNSVIQLGSEISYKNYDNSKNNTTTEWKFAGLKVKINLDQSNEKIKINYETELSKPNEDNTIGGSKAESSLTIPLNTPLILFQITLKTDGKNIESLPYISKIPLLGELFKSKSKTENFKTISAIVEVNKNE